MPIDEMTIIGAVVMTAEEVLRTRYIYSIAALVVFFIGAKLISSVLTKYILKITAKTKTDVDDMLVKQTHTPFTLLFILLGIRLAIVPLMLEEKIVILLYRVIWTLAVVLLFYIFVVLLTLIISALVRGKAAKKEAEVDENLNKIASKASKLILFLIGIVVILKIWQIELGPLLASLGIIGIAVAFGLQNTLGNIFGGISLLMDRSIKVGDIIKVDEETYGQVRDVGLRATKVRTWDNELVIIPNGKLAGVNIKNYVLPNPTARITLPFSVAYGSDVDEVKKVVMNEIRKLDMLDTGQEPAVMFLEMADSSLKFKAFVWLRSYKDRFSAKEKLNCLIYKALDKNKISIPFPQMDVHLKGRK